jgi:hypothetical protein
MPSEIKKEPNINQVSSLKAPGLVYKPSQSPWGLESFYEGYRLVFSGDFNPSRTKAEKWFKIFNLFTDKARKNPSGIISSVDLYQMFSKDAMHAWRNAALAAKKRKALEVCVEDIFLALLGEPSVKNMLARLKVDSDQAKIFINNYLKLTSALGGETVKKIPFEAFALAAKLHNHKIGTLMLLGGLLKATPKGNILQAIFANIGLTEAKLELFAVWMLDLNYEFSRNSASDKLLFCLRQSKGLEDHFGYFFEFPAIEAAVKLNQEHTLKDLQHLKALQILVKAGLLGKALGIKIISQSLVEKAVKK